MPKHKCPFPDCTYETEDISDEVAVVMITVHNSGVHTNTTTTTTQSCKVEKVKRPTIHTGGSSEEWSYFSTRWQEYAEATKIQGKEKAIQLLECCDETLRKDLTRNAGGSLVNKTADEVMAAIKKLAVRAENILVARVELHNTQQDRDEPIRNYAARLRGQANICKFTVTCPTCAVDINYTEQVLRDIITRGLADHEIQLDLLGDKNQNMSLDEVIQFIEAKEAGKRSAGRLQGTQSINATHSQYRKSKQDGLKSQRSTHKDTCSYCGQHGHGKRAPTSIRRNTCPAYGKTCGHCGRPNHIEAVCQQKAKPKPPQAQKNNAPDTEGAIFDSLCYSSCPISIDHHLYNALNDCWVRQSSKPQPFITLTTTFCPEDYRALDATRPEIPRRQLQIPAMADTGCQSCLASLKIIQRFGLQEKDLIPVTLHMVAASNKGINILGATIPRFSGESKSGTTLETRQITYITSDPERLFLSREACVAPGMISDQFPTVGEASLLTTPPPSDTSAGMANAIPVEIPESALTAPCNCPRRQKPPPRPTQPPLPANEANRARLQQWLLDYYATSTFNTCEHQPLPLMHGPPMRLMVNPDATPVAHHTPIPVPLHWQEDVKAGLDRDVALGVLEPVPIGEPVTWCHWMVVCAKKNGQPRRTVDLQALNQHATRETHHTQSPFHQDRSVPNNKKKTIFDCWNGYHSVAIHPDDHHLTTFITPWGRYRYKTAPQGYVASGDGFSRRFDKIVSEILDKTKCIDDALLWADNIEGSFFQAVDWLDTCGKNGITLNPEKFVFGQDTVAFAGFEITTNHVRPCQIYLDAILNFPRPSNITDVRSWFGLINQVSYAFAAADRMLPFREALKSGSKFSWTDELNQLFEEPKKVIVSEIEHGVQIFDKSKPTCLATDWSKEGIGFWLFQKHCDCPADRPFCCNTG